VPHVADPGGISVADRLANHGSSDPLDHPRTLITASEAITDRPGLDTAQGPDRWLTALDGAVATHRSMERQRSREIDHDLGLSL
jgi:hypothetical protein